MMGREMKIHPEARSCTAEAASWTGLMIWDDICMDYNHRTDQIRGIEALVATSIPRIQVPHDSGAYCG